MHTHIHYVYQFQELENSNSLIDILNIKSKKINYYEPNRIQFHLSTSDPELIFYRIRVCVCVYVWCKLNTSAGIAV